jgi:anti-sigma B factor antagonist
VDAARIETCRGDLTEVVVAVYGEIDVSARARLVSSLRAAVGMPGVNRVVVDLTGTSFMDASGIGALVVGREAARTLGVGYRVVGIAGQVHRILEITKMIEALAASDWPARDVVAEIESAEPSVYPACRPTLPLPLRSDL